MDYLKKDIIVPNYSYNALPLKLKDIKEIYNIIKNNITKCLEEKENKKEDEKEDLKCLFTKDNNINLNMNNSNNIITNLNDYDNPQLEISLLIFIFNKYNRKVQSVQATYFTNDDPLTIDFTQITLFSIPSPLILPINNTIFIPYSSTSQKNENSNPYILFLETKVTLEKLFPFPTNYEVFNYTLLPEYSHELIVLLEDFENHISDDASRKILDKYDKLEKELNSLNVQILEQIADNQGMMEKNKQIKIEIEKCNEENALIEKQNEKLKEVLKKFDEDKEEIKNLKTFLDENDLFNIKTDKEIEEMYESNKILEREYEYRIDQYKKEAKKDKNEILILEAKYYKTKIIIYFEIAIIILVTIVFVGYLLCKEKDNKKYSSKNGSMEEQKKKENYKKGKYMNL